MYKIVINIALVLFFTSGCLPKSTKQSVVIVDKSINQQNIQEQRHENETAKSRQPTSHTQKKSAPKSWSIPVSGKVIRSFSRSHPGLTFNTESGQSVRSIRDGVVVYTDLSAKKIIIKHSLGFYSTYTQILSFQVKTGQSVNKGQVLALTGKNPFYFEMKKFEEHINPSKYLK